MKKLYAVLASAGSFVLPYLAHAQFSVSTSSEAATNGAYLQTTYNELTNALTSTGVVTFLIVTTVLAIIVWLAVKRLRHIFSA